MHAFWEGWGWEEARGLPSEVPHERSEMIQVGKPVLQIAGKQDNSPNTGNKCGWDGKKEKRKETTEKIQDRPGLDTQQGTPN